MDWIHNYQFFLFDFDGLLVKTEKLHFQAYHNLCAARNIHLNWTFDDFTQIAHYHSSGLGDYLYSAYPELKRQEPSWEVLYQEKKNEFLKLIRLGVVELMPGVETLLQNLNKSTIDMCVVTHSSKVIVDPIRESFSCLKTIPHWITREDYHTPKPNPECYIKAINDFAPSNAKIIGFEDTPRGLSALMHTRATPVLISEMNYPEIPSFIQKGAHHFLTFNDVSL